MGANEDYCERVGSVMKSCHDPLADLDNSTLMDRVILREACVQCVGGSADQELCRTVARIMISMGRSPFLKERSKGHALHSLALLRRRQRERLRRAGRAASSDSGGDASQSDPLDFGEPGETAPIAGAPANDDGTIDLSAGGLRKTMSKTDLRAWMTHRLEESRRGARLTPGERAAVDAARPGGIVRAPPLFHEDVRTTAKRNRAGSSRDEATDNWLCTAEGIAWLSKHRKIAAAAEPSQLRASPSGAAASSSSSGAAASSSSSGAAASSSSTAPP